MILMVVILDPTTLPTPNDIMIGVVGRGGARANGGDDVEAGGGGLGTRGGDGDVEFGGGGAGGSGDDDMSLVCRVLCNMCFPSGSENVYGDRCFILSFAVSLCLSFVWLLAA